MEHRNNQHPDADQGSGQQQPDPPVPNPIVPNVLILRLPVPANQWNLTIPQILEYRYTVVFPYGSGYYYYHCFRCYDGGAVFWPTFPAPFPPVENVNDPNIRHHNPPRLEPLPEDEVVAPEILGHDEVDEVADQLQVLHFDINDHSYEEILALTEAIGNVSIGLSSEFIERNLNVRTFESLPTCGECVICLDEFKAGEIIGTLECGHEYHKHCIKRWLLGHNTCPLCKSPALRVD